MPTVHANPEYQMQIKLPAPPDYPTEVVPDEYTAVIHGTFESRKQDLLAHIQRNPAPNNTKMAYYELARWAAGGAPHEGVFHAAMDFIDARKDCSDFVLHSILRLLYQFDEEDQRSKIKDSPQQSIFNLQSLFSRAQTTVLNFKYWPEEAGVDSMCFWTENHHILFTSAAYLAGQLYPDAVFANSGQTGKEKMEKAHQRILRWLDFRFYTGFNEWLSHVYYDEDITALLSLVDFCQDDEIVRKSTMILDLLLLDMALNSFKGVFGSTHGRSYENTKKWASNEGTIDITKLMFGMGQYSGFDNMSAINLALSTNYTMPPVIEAIAHDLARPEMETKQRASIKLAEAEKWGIFKDGEAQPFPFEDAMFLLQFEAYIHPRTVNSFLSMLDEYRWWENGFFYEFEPYKKVLPLMRTLHITKPFARYFEWDFCRNTREEVNTYTYRTPDYMLSCAQDYRPGMGGDQHQIWQATLGADAVCFTTHPAKVQGVSPNYWAGSGQLPRAVQHKNVVICIYNLHRKPALNVPTKLFYTHAWFPKDQFDEVVEKQEWLFARKGDGYLALRSQRPFYWKTGNPEDYHTDLIANDAEDVNRELVAPGDSNIWICEMGRRDVDGEFGEFVERVATAVIQFNGVNVSYHSPSQGRLEFGWKAPFTQNGQPIQVYGYPRYDNPYVQAEFAPDEIVVNAGDNYLKLDWPSMTRDLEKPT
ncbi:MAG: hypothetical protein IAF02_12590 [Anaerolineae bacterium]|nr:hypothetical protein [Anaerolineae bacterium]